MELPLHLQTISIKDKRLGILVPDAEETQKAYHSGQIPFPYWSKIWPASIALSQFILGNPKLFTGKKVVELAAGLGLPSIAAASIVNSVHCTDKAPEAIAVVEKTIRHLGIHNITTECLDWNKIEKFPEADLILMSDVNYDPSCFPVLQKLFLASLVKGSAILLSTPQRLMAKDFITPLLPYITIQTSIEIFWENQLHPISIFLLTSSPDQLHGRFSPDPAHQ
jgi:predicted nicotinamide N-methyase